MAVKFVGAPEKTPGEVPVNSIDPATGKKKMPKSPGRPRGKSNRKVVKGKPQILNSESAKRVGKMLQSTASMTDSEILEKARQLKEAEESKQVTESGMLTGMRRDEMATMVYRLAVRGLTQNQIASQMGLTVKQVAALELRVTSQLKLDPKVLDVGYYMGESLAFYQEIRQMALLQSASEKNSASVKLNAMQVALQAEQQKNAFLTKIGVYSPTIVDRIERWVVGTTDQMTAPPAVREAVNLAAEVGRALSRRAAQSSEGVTDVESKA